MVDNRYNRTYFEDGTTGYLMYQDFINNYKKLEHVLALNPKSVLEIGGARGYLVKKLNDAGIPSINMDVSDHCYATRATDNFIVHDITDTPWPFTDKQFDVCVNFAVLEHIPEDKIDAVVAEIHRVSHRTYCAPSFDDIVGDHDVTHATLKPMEWWHQKLNLDTDHLVNKEIAEGGVVTPPAGDGLLKLNIGSYINMYHYGWVNIDREPLQKFAEQCGYIFLQMDLEKVRLYSFQRNSVDIILASHVLEHFDRPTGRAILEDCFRVLKDGGILRIAVPDTRWITNEYLEGSISRYKSYNVGVEKSPDDAQSLYEMLVSGHKTMYDSPSLHQILMDIGFDVIYKSAFNQSKSDIIKKQTIDMYPESTLYIEAKKVIHTKVASSSNNKLEIALVSTPFISTPPLHYGGLELVVANLGTALAKMGHDVSIIAAQGSKVPGCRMICTVPPAMTTNVNWLETEKEHYQRYKDILQNFDIVHDHTWFGFAYIAKQQNDKIKVIHTHHGGLAWKQRAVPKMNMVAISKFMKATYLSQGWLSEIVYNGIDVDRYPVSTKERDRLVFIGRLDKFKQPHVAIELAKKLDMKLDIIGGSFVTDDVYLNHIKNLCTTDKIKLHLDATHHQKIESLSHAKALIFPSNMGEPFGLVAAEAMAVGVPVIATNDGAISEVVEDGKTGYICKTMTQMEEMIGELDKIKSVDCVNRVHNMFTKEVMAKNYLNLYNDIIDGQEW